MFLTATRMAARTPELLQFLKGQRPQKLFHILNKVEGYGVGRRVTRVIWKQEELSQKKPLSYWTVTKVIPHKVVGLLLGRTTAIFVVCCCLK